MTTIEFNANAKTEFDKILECYPDNKESAIMPVLYLAQKEFGYISEDVIKYVARMMNLSPVRVEGVALFYTMYNKQPMGKYHLQVCHNISCALCDAENLIGYIQEQLQIKSGQTTDDQIFTLTEVECLGACGEGPIVQVNDEYQVNMTKEKVDKLLERLRQYV
jgi:NADH-quinone oxidoreductase E subunit